MSVYHLLHMTTWTSTLVQSFASPEERTLEYLIQYFLRTSWISLQLLEVHNALTTLQR